MTIKFAAIGECMLELRHEASTTLKLNFAGDTYNVLAYLARYRHFLNTTFYYVTAVGNDPYSNMMLKAWQQEGINVSMVHTFKHELSGLYLINTDNSGERHFYYYRSQAAAKKMFDSSLTQTLTSKLANFDYLYLSGITLAILDVKSRMRLLNLLKRARKQGATLIVDSNYRPILWENKKAAQQWTKKLFQLCDVALVTFNDERQLYEDKNLKAAIKRLKHLGPKEIVLKLGAKGCCVVTEEKEKMLPAIHVSKVVDTTAAGDSFNAGYISGRLNGLIPEAAAKLGQSLASVVVQYPGAIIPKAAMPKLFAKKK